MRSIRALAAAGMRSILLRALAAARRMQSILLRALAAAGRMRSILRRAVVAAVALVSVLALTLLHESADAVAAVCKPAAQDAPAPARMLPARMFTREGSCDVVAAEYEAAVDVAALVRILPDCRVFVYSKSHSCDEIRRIVGSRSGLGSGLGLGSLTCQELPNVGRESHTWVHHVLSHYADFSDRVYFVPLPLFDSERGRRRHCGLVEPSIE